MGKLSLKKPPIVKSCPFCKDGQIITIIDKVIYKGKTFYWWKYKCTVCSEQFTTDQCDSLTFKLNGLGKKK